MEQEDSSKPHLVLERVWGQLQVADGKGFPNRLGPNAKPFITYAWDNFDPQAVIGRLLDESPAYDALKPILFSGLCTWVVSPSKHSLRRHGMLLVGIEHLQAAELAGRDIFSSTNWPGFEVLGDFVGRTRVLGPDFFSDFYNPIGGLDRILRTPTKRNFRKNINKHSTAALTAVSMMEVYDYHTKCLSDQKLYYQKSEGMGYKLVRKIRDSRRDTGISVELSKERWIKLEASRTAALSYAASTLPITDKLSLLDAICEGAANFEDHGKLLLQWIGRARYAAGVVLGDFTKPEIGRINLSYLPDIPMEITPIPEFTADEQNIIVTKFARSKLTKRRRN